MKPSMFYRQHLAQLKAQHCNLEQLELTITKEYMQYRISEVTLVSQQLCQSLNL